MTLPTTIILPDQYDLLESGDPKNTVQYMRNLVNKLNDMYESIARNVNGSIRTNNDQETPKWTPIIKDQTNTATTFTYANQTGWVLRTGILVDCWFDVRWIAASGATGGNMYLELPYKVARTENIPFVGVLQTSSLTYTTGDNIVINAFNNTYEGQLWNYASGIATGRQRTAASGRIIGHIRYMGQDERGN
jgi:hypothetical protein